MNENEVMTLVRKIIDAGPFYDGIDDDFCAVCHAHFAYGEDHRDDCAYVALKQLFERKDQ